MFSITFAFLAITVAYLQHTIRGIAFLIIYVTVNLPNAILHAPSTAKG